MSGSTLLRNQEQVSIKRGQPTNEVNMTALVARIAPITVQLFFYNAGVRTADAGQAASTVVEAVFPHKNIQNVLGTNIASKNDTSLVYTCLALTSEVEITSKPGLATLMEALDDTALSTRSAQIGALLENGEFVIDYRRGLLIGKKATAATTMTAVTYLIPTAMNINAASLVTVPYDSGSVTWNAGTFTEVFTFKSGGLSGTTVAVVTLIYSDASKNQLVSFAKA